MASIAIRPDDLSGQGEIKSMRTAAAHVRKGVAARLLQHIVQVARQRGYAQLYLETGPGPAFAAALALYARHGFVECAPFADYVEDPFSVFMVLELSDAQAIQKLLASGTAEPVSKPFKLGAAENFSPGPDGSNMSDLVIALRKPK